MDRELILRPLLGLKTDVPPDDESLLIPAGDNVFISRDTGGLNVSYRRTPNVCTKSEGYTEWSNSACAATVARSLGLFELDDGVNRDNLNFENGRVFYYDGSKDPQQLNNAYLSYDGQTGNFTVGLTITGTTSGTTAVIAADHDSGTTGQLYLQTVSGSGFQNNEPITDTDTGAAVANGTMGTTTFANTEGDLYSAIKHGSYIVFADYAEHEPYKWKNGDQRLTPLITKRGATIYKFKYLLGWQRRIIGAYSDITNGDLEIRYTGALPTMSDLEFTAGNQLYKSGTDKINGISLMGANSAYLYGTDSIHRLQYQANITIPFSILPYVEEQGCAGHWSIVNAQGANFFFNKNYGFVRYLGGSTLISDDIISGDIEDIIQTIDSRYYERIVGRYLPHANEIVWAIPYNAATTPDYLLYYDLKNRTWRWEDKACRAFDIWTRSAGQYRKPVYANADGKVYQITGELDPTAGNLSGYRIEPILSFGSRTDFTVISRVAFGIVTGGSYSLHLWHRSGDTVKEVEAASWTAIGTLSLNAPAEPWINCPSLRGRLHQFKWGTDSDSELFGINELKIYYHNETAY